MTEFHAVTVRGPRTTYGSGVVIARPDIDAQRGEMAGGAGKTMTAGYVQGLRRRGDDVLRVSGYGPIHGAAQLRPLTGGQPQDSALPNRLRAAAALDLFATPRTHDGTGLPERFGPGERGRWGFCPVSGPKRRRLFRVLALPGRPGRTS